jgi:hypothetical protein
MNSMVKMLIIVTLIYYLLKGLIYLMLWIATHKVEENARNRKRKQRELRAARISATHQDGSKPY